MFVCVQIPKAITTVSGRAVIETQQRVESKSDTELLISCTGVLFQRNVFEIQAFQFIDKAEQTCSRSTLAENIQQYTVSQFVNYFKTEHIM